MASLNDCRAELNAIITEMDRIEWEVRQGAHNVGEDKCADTVSRINDKFRKAKRKLDSVDLSKLAEWAMGE